MKIIDFFMIEVMPWILSALTLYRVVQTGNLHRKAWLYGVWNQGLWLVWILYTQIWGFLPMCLGLAGLYFRNHLKWQQGALRVKSD